LGHWNGQCWSANSWVANPREMPIGDSLLMRVVGAVSPRYAQAPQNLIHPVNDGKSDHQSQ
jgi:hypothetical protein